MIYCLLFSGSPITKTISDELFKAACRMVLEDKDELAIYNDECCGMVETDWESVCLGAISGYKFSCDVSSIKGQHKVDFIVRSKDLENIDFEKKNWHTFDL